MLNKSLNKESINRLFLICPTDNMEKPILNHFNGSSYFYTALGAYLEFDYESQSKLWDLVYELEIEKIVFVTSINNVFCRQVFNSMQNRNYPVDIVLAETKKEISKHLIQPEVFFSNIHLLIAKHLKNQKERLLATSILGNHLKEQNIFVEAYAYHPEKWTFSNCYEVEKIGNFLSEFSCN